MTISLSKTVNEGVQAQCPFPLYILLARLGSITEVGMISLELTDIANVFVYFQHMHVKISGVDILKFLMCGPKVSYWSLVLIFENCEVVIAQ